MIHQDRVCPIVGSIWVLALLLVGGCATISHVFDDLGTKPMHRDSLIYAGTRYHIHEIPLYATRNRSAPFSNLFYSLRWWHYVDLPLCLAADTLLLPYTVPRTVYSNWRNKPTKAERAIAPFREQYALCRHNLNNLEFEKQAYAKRRDLSPSDDLPQDLDVYRDLVCSCNRGSLPLFVCPAGGEYTVGGQGDAPFCSMHGTAEQAMEAMEYMYKEKKLPDLTGMR